MNKTLRHVLCTGLLAVSCLAPALAAESTLGVPASCKALVADAQALKALQADGRELWRAGVPANVEAASLSADGRRLAYVLEREPKNLLHLVTADGRASTVTLPKEGDLWDAGLHGTQLDWQDSGGLRVRWTFHASSELRFLDPAELTASTAPRREGTERGVVDCVRWRNDAVPICSGGGFLRRGDLTVGRMDYLDPTVQRLASMHQLSIQPGRRAALPGLPGVFVEVDAKLESRRVAVRVLRGTAPGAEQHMTVGDAMDLPMQEGPSLLQLTALHPGRVDFRLARPAEDFNRFGSIVPLAKDVLGVVVQAPEGNYLELWQQGPSTAYARRTRVRLPALQLGDARASLDGLRVESASVLLVRTSQGWYRQPIQWRRRADGAASDLKLGAPQALPTELGGAPVLDWRCAA